MFEGPSSELPPPHCRWTSAGGLGLSTVAIAMVVNLLAAAMAGVAIPVLLDRFGIDPAVASGTFVTTVTDVVGFFSFLGVAAIWLALA